MINSGERPLRLVFWEPDVGDPIGQWWGQLAGGAHRLQFAADQLRLLPGRKPTARALNELAYHVENYFTRVYELRERAPGLVTALTGRTVGAAKDPSRRSRVLADLRVEFPALEPPFAEFLQTTDPDIAIRNDHTHNQFVDIRLFVGDDNYDPGDALLDVWRTDARRPLERVLRRDIGRWGAEYSEKAATVWSKTWELLSAARTGADVYYAVTQPS